MAGKNTSVFGIYPSYSSVKDGGEALKAAGFRNTDISVLFPENIGTKDFAHEKNAKDPGGRHGGRRHGTSRRQAKPALISPRATGPHPV